MAVLLLCAVAVAAVISSRGSSSHRSIQAPPPRSAPVPATLTTRTSRRATDPQLTLQQLAGQRIVYAFAGPKPPASLLAAVRAGEAGGVILFGNNITSPAQIRAVVDELQRAALASPLHTRLLILTDQEGGKVRRLPGAPLLSEKQIGQAANGSAAARAAGAGAGQNLRSVGINVNLAPVLDVYRRPSNFIDEFGRSYSSAPARVAALGAAFIAAQQRTGVAATAKHFPGLGSATASQNTDLRPVSLGASLSTLRSMDEQPYRSAIAGGLKLIMTSWAIYLALDSRLPAGLSSAVIQGELRRRLRFRGVTITDGIDAGALARYGNLSRRAVLAAAAGADLILCATTDPSENTPSQGITARGALATAIAHRQVDPSAAQQAASRILALRRSVVG